MSTVAVKGSSHAACTLLPGDVVEVDGRDRVIATVLDKYATAAIPFVILRFTDGSSRRVHPGDMFAVHRPR